MVPIERSHFNSERNINYDAKDSTIWRRNDHAVLLFAFNGLVLALSIAFQNEDIVGSLAADGTFWNNIWGVLEQGGWMVFNHMELLFVLGLPIGLAKKAQGRAVLEAFVIYTL